MPKESEHSIRGIDLEDLRRYADKALLPVAQTIALSPNTITCFALLAMILASGLVMLDKLAWAGILILVSGVLDLLDGTVARTNSRATPFGALLDRVADRAADFSILAGIILGGYVDPRLGIYVLATVLLGSYISACLEAATSSNIGQKISLRGMRVVILALACLTATLPEGMILLAVLGTYASGARLIFAYRTLR